MLHRHPSRRDFVRAAGAAGGGWLLVGAAGCREAAESAARAVREGVPPEFLSSAEARVLEAIADRIIPPDGDAPGAAAGGAVSFMDHYLARRAESASVVRDGLERLVERVRASHPGVEDFASLDAEARDALLRAVEGDDEEFFAQVRWLTIAGTFSDPARGGNRDEVGWALLAYDNRHVWQPPFGAYDAAAAEGGDR